jgi:hypothetical protein
MAAGSLKMLAPSIIVYGTISHMTNLDSQFGNSRYPEDGGSKFVENIDTGWCYLRRLGLTVHSVGSSKYS